MQSVQTTILDKTIPLGETPVMIIAPDFVRGNDLAVLLSLNLVTKRNFSRLQDDLEEDNHYFLNKTARRIINGIRKSNGLKVAENRDKIKLLLEESADNGKMWGLLCDYSLFFDQQLYNLYDDYYFIFLYDDAGKMPVTNATYLQQINDICTAHPNDCLLVHMKQLSAIPEMVLASLPFHKKENMTVALKAKANEEEEDEDDDLTIYLKDKAPVLKPAAIGTVDSEVVTSLNKLNAYNFISSQQHVLKGDKVTAILLFDGPQQLSALVRKVNDIHHSFVTLPELYILCANESDKAVIEAALNVPGLDNIARQVFVAVDRIAVVNQLVYETRSEIIVVDNLHLSTHYPALLQPYQDKMDGLSISFGNVSATHQAGLSEFLTTHIIQDAVAFTRKIWDLVGGFEPTLDNSVFLWDFAINVLKETKGIAMAVNATASDSVGETPEKKELDALLNSAAYQAVIMRHQDVFEENIQSLIELFTQYMHLPQHEIKGLNQQISSLHTMQAHAKNELRAVTDLSKALQKRINTLEDRWHYKLNARIKKLKKIFFKKNTTGTGRLKKILRFLAFTMSKPGMAIVRKVSKTGFKKMYLLAEDRPVKISYLDEADDDEVRTYNDWIKIRQKPDIISKAFNDAKDDFSLQPKISIVMPVYNPPLNYLKQAIESVLKQDYKNWELCIADDNSPGEKTGKLLKAYSMKDSRIKLNFRKENGHISACSNSALELATGDYILFMDHDDLLSIDCLFEVVKHINEFPENDIIYSDEDKVNEAERHTEPHFKPDWAPNSLLSRNYFGHVVVMRKSIVDAVGGFRLGFEGSQDYDIILRATEQTEHIGHIPKVLYHWRIHGKSAAQSEDVKPYAYIAAKKALEETLVRRNTPGNISYLSGLRGYRIKYDIPSEGKVSIIIPTKDHVKLLKNTVDSILHHTDYKNYEIIVLNNNSSSKDFFSLVADYTANHSDCFRSIDCNFPFNFSKLMNIGREAASGEYLLFLNNDVEIIHEDWLRQMVAYAQHKQNGAIGVKLLYPDDHIQHAGVIVGLGGVAGHAFLNAYKDDPGYFNYIQSVNNFSAVTAACMLCRTEIYDEVNGMDESFEVEYNDVDLCLKFMDAGYYNIYLPDVELYHYESATRGHPHQSRESWDRHVREIKLFKAKWQKYIDHDPYYNPNLNIGAHDFSMNFSANSKNAEKATGTIID